jgi:hypothetical protein
MAPRNVLVVDDLATQANIARDKIKDRPGYRPFSPPIEDLLSSILFRTYEGAMIDVIWENPVPVLPDKVLDRYSQITDGIDFADFIFRLNPKLKQAIAIYSTAADLDERGLDQRIRNLPFKPKRIQTPFSYDHAHTKKLLAPLLNEVDRVHRSNPLLQPTDFLSQPLNARIQTYRAITLEYSNWLDFQFDVVGDYSWAMMCGADIEKKDYGMPLNGGNGGFNVSCWDRYPVAAELEQISKRTKFFPFMLWNTRKPEFIEAQFEYAGEQLRKIPEKWRHFFAISVAHRCADLYRDGHDGKVLKWCRDLDNYGRVEVAKQIHKSLRREDPASVERFGLTLEKHELPVIVDVLLGKVDSFDDERKSARIVMKTHHGEYFTESLSQTRLARSNIRFVDTWFEYTVYRQPKGEVVADIEPCDPEEESL